MSTRILHVLSQRPGRTGSGVILDTLVRHAASRGYQQKIVIGIPADDPPHEVGGLGGDALAPVRFESGALNFPVPGMSDVMPYRSTVWSTMTGAQLECYRAAWRSHLAKVVASFRPDLIHAHHIWLMSSMLRDIAPSTPIVLQCHGTGLRQMALCPSLAPEVRRGCAGADAFQVLREDHVDELVAQLGIERSSIHVVPAGFREDLFHDEATSSRESRSLLYVGKYSHAKGLPQLLDAFERLNGVHLHVAGDGSGAEAEALRERMADMNGVTLHGQVDQSRLAELMRKSEICVLPSYYEGVPLVLVEAAACGCKVVSTALPGVVEQIAPVLGPALTLVEPPAMDGIDTPSERALPEFVDGLTSAIERSLESAALPGDVAALGWGSIFARVESIWKDLTAAQAR